MIDLYKLLYNIRNEGHLIYLNSNNELVLRKNKDSLLKDEDKSILIQNKKYLIEILSKNNIYSGEDFINSLFFKFTIDDLKKLAPHLSPIQLGVYMQSLRDNIKVTYNIPVLLKAKGINIRALETSIKKLFSDNRILRMMIDSNQNYSFADLNEIKINKLQIESGEVAEYINNSSSHVFELNNSILITQEICQIKDTDDCIINLTHHHILSDGNSLDIMISQLLENYQSIIDTKEIPNRSQNLDYLDYAQCQNILFEGDDYIDAIKNLTEKLKSTKPVQLHLKNTAFDNYGQENNFNISKDKLDELNKVSSGASVSLYTLLITVWYYVLKVYSSTDEAFPIGLTVSNRKNKFSDAIGPFISTLPLIFDFSEDSTLQTNLKKVNSEIMFLNQYGDINLNQIIEKAEIQSDLIPELMQIMFTMHNYSKVDILNNNSTFEFIDIEEKTEKFGITVICKELSDGLSFKVTYAKNRYENWLIESLLAKYKYLLSNISVECLEQPLNKIPFLSEEEYQTIVYDWNKTGAFYPKDKTIHQLFEEQVEKTPDNIAVVFEDKQLTYRELNEKANQLADTIRKEYVEYLGKNIKGDTLIGIYIERSLEMIIGILGILKSGAAYIPFDSDDPEERLKFKINDCGCQMVVTLSGRMKDLLFLAETDTIPLSIDSYWDEISKNAKTNPKHINKSTDLAYVIYTSGSTGNPKGVLIEHCSLINRLSWMQKEYNFNENEIVLQKTPYSFDVSVWELLLPGISGSKQVFAKPEGHKDPSYLIELIKKEKITKLHFVPSMLNGFISYLEDTNEKLESIKDIICSGEALGRDLSGRALKVLPNISLHNLYGPTEATIDASYHQFDKEACYGATVPIGKAVQNYSLYILDETFNPVPVGVSGELYIGGDGLARGYLNRIDLTEERFIENPFASEEDRSKKLNFRIYKTGDIVRWLSDGSIEYIGRNDDQVKIRGLRIELGEIASKLSGCPNINQSVVLCKEKDGKKYLVAYYTSDSELTDEKIRDYLSKILPDYMIPSTFVYMEEFLLNTSGKIDKKVLPDAEFNANKESYIAPSNEIESKLCDIWQNVLGVDRVGIDNNFFRIGGDSILSIQIVSKMRSSGFNISVKDIFDLHTIKKLAEFIQNTDLPHSKKEEDEYKPFSLINKKNLKNIKDVDLESVEDAFPASYLQVGMMLESELSEDGTYHDVFAYKIEKEFKYEKFSDSFKKLAEKHALLRSSFIPQEDYGYIVLQHKYIDINEKIFVIDDKFAGQLLEEEKINNFEYAKPGLFRVIILEKKTNSFILVFSFHHTISDGWSVASLISEFVDIYVNGYDIDPGVENLFYGEFISEEMKALNDDMNKEFWKNYLSEYEPVNSNFRVKAQNRTDNQLIESGYELTDDESKKILDLANELGVSVDTVFLAIYFVLLSCFYNSEDIVVGLVVNNRLEKEGGDKMFGLFLNALPLRLIINKADNPGIKELINNIYKEKVKLFSYKAYPYGKIKTDLSFQDDIYKCAFNYIHFHVTEENFVKGNIKEEKFFEKTNIPLTLNVSKDLNKFTVTFKGLESFIDTETIGRFKDYLLFYLKQIGNERFLSLIPEQEYNQLIYGWNKTETFYPEDKTIQQLFEMQVEKTPEHIAIVFGDKQLTYRELNEKTNQLANTIRNEYIDYWNENVKADTLIGIYIERSLEMIIGILGILKSGAAYVPFDMADPEDRLKFKINDCGCKIVLTSNKSMQYLLSLAETDTIPISIDSYWDEISKNPKTNTEHINKSTDLAYIIYTSGSTGNPKGVMIEHKSVINLIFAEKELLKISRATKALQFASLAFDASVWEIFPVLTLGGTLYMVEEDTRKDSHLFMQYIKNKKISMATIPPAYLSLMPYKEFPDFNTLIVAGDSCDPELMKKWSRNRRMINAYGPTESTVCATMHHYNIGDSNNDIGKPIHNTKVYVLDNSMTPVPVGVSGELYIGGDSLSRGYLNRTELTSERFIENPFTAEEKKNRDCISRIYKTGDMVRWLPDGNLEYLGRNDHQVKIRGFRVELGEIESKLSSHPSVVLCTVIVRKQNEDKYLCAYYTVKDSTESGISDELRKYLAGFLPDYMVPAFFTELAAMPLNTSGKIDKKILPDPELNVNKDAYEPPNTETEKKICMIWEEILGIEKLGINDDFFSIGGNSIKAVSMIAKLRSGKLDIAMSDIFKNRTIKTLSEVVKHSDTNLFEKLSDLKKELRKVINNSESESFKSFVNEQYNKYNENNQKLVSKLKLEKQEGIKNILLTGATGYLGSHILKELINLTDYKIYCIVRRKSKVSSLKRLKEILHYYLGDFGNAEIDERITVIDGDLSLDNLGLSDDDYKELSTKIDSILHAAANVNHYGEYKLFYKDNVLPVINLCDFAANHKKKSFHYISTRSVCEEASSKETEFHVFDEDTLPNKLALSDNVYVRTKLEGEIEALKARATGLDVSIYRIGNLVFNSTTGKHQKNLNDNAFSQIVRTYLNIGFIPKIIDRSEMSCVDLTAKAICVLFDKTGLENQIFHLYNPHIIALFDILTHKELGVDLQKVELEEFIDILCEKIKDPLLAKYINDFLLHMGWLDESIHSHIIETFNSRTNLILEKLNFHWNDLKPSDFKVFINDILINRKEG